MSKNVDQAVILDKFEKWLKIKAKQDPDSFSEKKVKDLIEGFDSGYCSGLSWMHRLQKHKGQEQLYFYQMKKMANWNGKKSTLDPDLDHLFNQFIQISIFAHQAWATAAATSTDEYYDGVDTVEGKSSSKVAAEGLLYRQTDSIIGRNIAPADEAIVITSFQDDHEPMNKEQTRQRIESLLKDNANAMLAVSGQCYSMRDDPSKHEYHAVDLGVSEVDGRKKYWLYDPNHPKGTRYFDNFDKLFDGLQKAFFYNSILHKFSSPTMPLEFQRYESLDFEQKNFEISLKSVAQGNHNSTESELNTDKRHNHGKSHRHGRAHDHDHVHGHGHRKSHRKTLRFIDPHKNNKPPTFNTLHRRKIVELTNIIEQLSTNSRIEIAIRDEDKTVQIEKLEKGYALWLSGNKEKIVVNDLETVFRLIKDHNKNFWKKSDIVTIFTKQFTDESKQKASLELEFAIETEMLDTVKWCIANGALEKFNPAQKKHHGHNPLTIALTQRNPNLDIIQAIINYDVQHNLGLSDHIMNVQGVQKGLNAIWVALLLGNTDILNCIKTNYPEKKYNPMNEGMYEGLSPLAVVKMQRSPSYVEALSKCYPEMLTANPQQKLSSPKN